MTTPSSAHTLALVTSQSWPVRMARGVVNSDRKHKRREVCTLQTTASQTKQKLELPLLVTRGSNMLDPV